MTSNKPPKVNQQIQSNTVRLILKQGHRIVSREEAIRIARENHVDLIQINHTTHPPICKLQELGKYLYEKEKSSKQNKAPKVKEIQLHPNIAAHDLATKIKQTREFLAHHHPVTIKMKFRGRENSHRDIGEKVMKSLIEETKDLSQIHGGISKTGNLLLLKLHPQKKGQTHHEPKT